MSYHIGNLGAFGAAVAGYVDADGYVPEPGDVQTDFSGLSDVGDWRSFVEGAATATSVAEAAIAEWRGGRVPIAGQIAVGRAREGWTQAELAERTGVPQSKISEYERGVRTPSVETLKRLSDAIGPFLL